MDRMKEFFERAAMLNDASGAQVSYPPEKAGEYLVAMRPGREFHGDEASVCAALAKRHQGCSFAFAVAAPPVRKRGRK
jgi:hypothetical protein